MTGPEKTSLIYVHVKFGQYKMEPNFPPFKFFKPGTHQPPGFLEIAFVREVGMRVCVCPPDIKNYLREIKPE